MAHLEPWREFSRVASFLSWLLKGATNVDKNLYLNQLDLCKENCHELYDMEWRYGYVQHEDVTLLKCRG
jgi:hypothetical protein